VKLRGEWNGVTSALGSHFNLEVLQGYIHRSLRVARNALHAVTKLPIMNPSDHPAVCTQVPGLGKHG